MVSHLNHNVPFDEEKVLNQLQEYSFLSGLPDQNQIQDKSYDPPTRQLFPSHQSFRDPQREELGMRHRMIQSDLMPPTLSLHIGSAHSGESNFPAGGGDPRGKKRLSSVGPSQEIEVQGTAHQSASQDTAYLPASKKPNLNLSLGPPGYENVQETAEFSSGLASEHDAARAEKNRPGSTIHPGPQVANVFNARINETKLFVLATKANERPERFDMIAKSCGNGNVIDVPNGFMMKHLITEKATSKQNEGKVTFLERHGKSHNCIDQTLNENLNRPIVEESAKEFCLKNMNQKIRPWISMIWYRYEYKLCDEMFERIDPLLQPLVLLNEFLVQKNNEMGGTLPLKTLTRPWVCHVTKSNVTISSNPK
ncbi:hypothetical protein PGTUg99_037118 [Puccinia graminis f. sp. tritici]|uniref:Uncharacterized protein n=1 Tax=Puccinia graminis f. sp. tritici TaxID=56615 RepID=A0A5B0PPM5_PUCGR|nr:hypothetical protein PGTUg99_037118 [Puccinia graminis f. sp. tritici]